MKTEMNITNSEDLKSAVKRQEPELVITDPQLIKRVRLLMNLRTVANVLVFAILAIAVFMWANPLKILLFEGGTGRLIRQILLGVGILLLFAEYLLPVARLYKVASIEEERLKLVLRKLRG